MMLAGCAIETGGGPGRPTPPTKPRPTASTRQVDPRLAERLQRLMIPLVQNMNRPLPLNQVRVGIIDNNQVNAANAGGGEFYVTVGLLERANDEQLRGVLAHEVAHADLGHVAKTQLLGVGRETREVRHDGKLVVNQSTEFQRANGTFTSALPITRPPRADELHLRREHSPELPESPRRQHIRGVGCTRS